MTNDYHFHVSFQIDKTHMIILSISPKIHWLLNEKSFYRAKERKECMLTLNSRNFANIRPILIIFAGK